MPDKLRIGVLFGGRSGEHEVSLSSVQSVLAAIDKDRYEIRKIGIDKQGRWLFDNDPLERLVCGEQAGEDAPMWPSPDDLAGIDVIVPILHGTYGEDGTLQGLLDLAGIAYVGCGVLASSLAMDKAVSRMLFAAHGLPQTPWRVVFRQGWQAQPDEVIADLESHLTYPMFTKPANLGSSVGIAKCHDRAELRRGLDDASAYDRKVVVEQAVANAREIEISVLGNDDPVASLPGEIVPSNEFYDYAAKYIDGESREIIPAPIGPELTNAVQEMAVQAFRAVDGSGLSRVDFLLNDATGELFLNEVNTMPGFTNISMYPKLWQASGLSYTALLDRLIELALQRQQERSQNRTTYDVNQDEGAA
ncbi:MAG: D-alanine--D-alanine ligase [Caldilineales bacterium]|nr:D-alanine--D-alanine ligase [Caldilineales bacterium]